MHPVFRERQYILLHTVFDFSKRSTLLKKQRIGERSVREKNNEGKKKDAQSYISGREVIGRREETSRGSLEERLAYLENKEKTTQ